MDFEKARTTLRRCQSLAGLDAGVLGILLLEGKLAALPSGATLFQRGVASGDRFCLVLEGAVVVKGADGRELTRLGPSDLVGEIGVVSPAKKRTADVVADGDAVVLEWNFGALPAGARQALESRLEQVAFERLATGLN